MKKKAFRVKAIWDAEAEVFYSESDIEGLHIEAANLEEFEAVLLDVAPDLIVANHMSESETRKHAVRDLIPTIVWDRPAMVQAEA